MNDDNKVRDCDPRVRGTISNSLSPNKTDRGTLHFTPYFFGHAATRAGSTNDHGNTNIEVGTTFNVATAAASTLKAK